MITELAKNGVDRIFQRAALENLKIDAGDSIEIKSLHGNETANTPENKIVVLTIVSYFFRLLTIFHINDEKTVREYFTKGNPDRDLSEAFSEIGNLCCGAMNRDLGKHFMHTGMSTPFTLAGKSISFLNELKPSYISRHRIEINNAIHINATLCLCAYAPIDFHVEKDAEPEETGLLELF